ncbi:aspartyl protease family protein [Flavilitoribacter nigricans]|uniref:aspartyl protease family protein n=1 Tax=Flavilitoribacter nigricans TaxID=70997 RepID=UPI001474B778|nr:retropepsin-like aspartic protease [Flavilitoribacter nigricans]
MIWALLFIRLPDGRATEVHPPPEDWFFSCSLNFPLAIQPNPNTIYIPFKLVGRLIAVEAQADSINGTFILDTGAERLLLNSNHYQERQVEQFVSIGNTGTVKSVSNRWVDSLYWDNLTFSNVRANIVDLTHIEQKKHIRLVGIIGYNVFKDFEIFIDFQSQQVVLTRLDKDGYRLDPEAIWESPYDSMDFKLVRHLIMIEAEVQGRKLKFNVDSGAEVNLLDRKVKRKVLDDFEIIRRVKMVGVGQNEIEVLAGVLHNVTYGNQSDESMRTLITNLLEMCTTFGTRIDGVVGYEFLSSRRTLINYKRKKLFFFQQQRP